MELMFPQILFIGIPIAIILTFFVNKRKDTFKNGKKVANTGFIKESPLYKKLIIKYRIFSIAAISGLWLSLLFAILMLSRPAKVDTVETDLRNRDIFICMDISNSVDELNLEICGEIRKMVKELNGERFGITIFNGQPVLLVPLTTDYDYILETLDHLEAAFECSLKDNFSLDNYDLYQYKYEGTLCERGSSFIGEGLAACLFNFPDLKENDERSRLIIFTTDNELNGVPLISVEDAAALCRANNVKVFAVTPEHIVDQNSFANAMIDTKGGYYPYTSNKIFDELLDDIRLTDASTMQDVKTIVTEKPEILFVCLMICISICFIAGRKVKL